MVMEAMKQACADRDLREMMRAREMARHEWATQMENATQQGIELGKREVARKMLAQGLDSAIIFQVTGFSPDQL